MLGLVGQIPANTIGNLTQLRILSLRANRLSGSIPSDFSNLKLLRSLYLQNNLFSGKYDSNNGFSGSKLLRSVVKLRWRRQQPGLAHCRNLRRRHRRRHRRPMPRCSPSAATASANVGVATASAITGCTRYVIYVKKGTYKENVVIGSSKKLIMLTGDGMDLTIITGSLNVVDGATTFNSATVAAVGDGFMAQDIWFQNTAGPAKHQAVALRVGGDQSVINRCRIDAYQDTLYTYTNRQFYRDSYITGTVDFIFGNAAVVFQNCKIVGRKPMSGQFNTITAQGRTDPNQNTGTSIQSCNVIASSDLEPVKGTIKSYLGRPWKAYARTVFMESYIGDYIDPTGWSVWSGDFALSTLYYGEYMNNGPGAGTSKRVTWAGYHVITSATEATKFTVAQLIQGGSWLKSTGVTYTEGL